jgi:hypothetical protein
LYWHKCQCWQVAQHECKFRICSIRCAEPCRLDMPINCLRKMEKAKALTAAFSKSCLVTVFICLTLFCRGALLSRRSFVVALFCRCALLSLRSYCGSLLSRAHLCGGWVVIIGRKKTPSGLNEMHIFSPSSAHVQI